MTDAGTIFNYASAMAAFVAAAFWYVSATVHVPVNDKPDSDGWSQASISVDGNDFIASRKERRSDSHR